MTKDELVAMVHERTAAPAGMAFNAASLNDLIKDRLVVRARREGNTGRRPIYRFDWRDVHRVTFIVAMQASGVRGRDALRLRLFVAGCRLPADDVRQALLEEYRRAVASLKMRSAQFDNRKALTPKRLASVTREIGRADPVLRDAGLEVPAAVTLQLLRAARQDPLASLDGLSPTAILGSETTIQDLAETDGHAFAGMLLANGQDDDDPTARDSIEGVIRNADEAALLTSRAYLRALARQMGADGLWGLVRASNDPQGPRSVILRTIKRSPPYLAFCLALALRVGGPAPEITTPEQFDLLNWLLKDPQRVLEFQAAASPGEKEALAREFFQKFKAMRDSQRR